MALTQTGVNFLIKEFETLKDEQQKRIEFRDHMIYLTLGVAGAVFSFGFKNPAYNISFLVLPFVTTILGWTYFTNDRKISAIGKYIKNSLIPQLSTFENNTFTSNWEETNSNEAGRKGTKFFQLIMDLVLFPVSAFASIGAFYNYHDCICWYHYVIMGIETVLLIFLTVKFVSNHQD